MTSLQEAPTKTPQKTLRVAVAGLGVGSTQILPAMAELPEIELVAAADVRPQALEAFRAKYGGRVYGTVAELCQDPGVDAIWVSTPNQYHCEHTIVAAEHGKHVVIEKPMALSIAEAERMVEAVERNGVQLLCGHTQSFNPAFQEMRRIIASGQLGRLCALNVWSYTDWMLRPRMPQEVDLEFGGGIPYRQGPHQVDTIRLLAGGMAKSVRAMTGQWLPERRVPGYYSAYVEFEGDVPATIVHNGYGHFMTSELIWGWEEQDQQGIERRIQARTALQTGAADEERAKEAMRFGGQREGEMAHRETGRRRAFMPGDVGIVMVSCEGGDMRQATDGNGVIIYDAHGRREVAAAGSNASRSSELLELYDAVIHGHPVFHGGRWGMATLEVCLAIMQSAREHREIQMTHQSPLIEH